MIPYIHCWHTVFRYKPSCKDKEKADHPMPHQFHPSTTLNLMFIPFRGLAVIGPCIFSFSFTSFIVNSNRPTNFAIKQLSSALACPCPIQLLGPCEKLIKA